MSEAFRLMNPVNILSSLFQKILIRRWQFGAWRGCLTYKSSDLQSVSVKTQKTATILQVIFRPLKSYLLNSAMAVLWAKCSYGNSRDEADSAQMEGISESLESTLGQTVFTAPRFPCCSFWGKVGPQHRMHLLP